MSRYTIIWQEILWLVLALVAGTGWMLSFMVTFVAGIVLAGFLLGAFMSMDLDKVPKRLKMFWWSKDRVWAEAKGNYVYIYQSGDGYKRQIESYHHQDAEQAHARMDLIRAEFGNKGNDTAPEAKVLAKVLNER